MKYEVGDKILVLLTNEEGKVVDIINEKMVMIDVKGVQFPAYLDQIDFPYFKMFTEKKKEEKKKIFIDNVKTEKKKNVGVIQTGEMLISFVPIFNKDIFDDDIVEKFKIYLINKTNYSLKFKYTLCTSDKVVFELLNSIEPSQNFYLHDVSFEVASDNPQFQFEFSLSKPDKKKAAFYESVLKLKPKQMFKKIEELKLKNESSFSYVLFDNYPDYVPKEKIDLSKLSNSGFRMYDAGKIRENIPAARTVIDLHIEKITDSWSHLSNFEIMSLQLNEFEKYCQLSVLHKQPTLTVIHGVGEGKLKDEIHIILKTKKEVKSYINQYTAEYGYGATQIYFSYK